MKSKSLSDLSHQKEKKNEQEKKIFFPNSRVDECKQCGGNGICCDRCCSEGAAEVCDQCTETMW